MWGFIVLGITVAAGIVGFGIARGFVRRRLRFVDAVRSPVAPLIAGVIAAVIAFPLTIIPLVGHLITVGTAAVFAIGTGLGTASGVKALKRGE